LRRLVRSIRDALLGTADTVCLERARLVTEAWREHEGEPAALRRAHAFAHVLAHMTLDLSSNPVFAGNTSSRPRAWMLVPEHGFGVDPQIALENPGLEGHLEGRLPAEIVEYWRERSVGGHAGIGHLAVDMGRAVHEGLESIVAEAEAFPDEPDPEKRDYRRAMVVALRAVIDWAHRYAEAAEAAARRESDPLRRSAHLRVARACRQVPARPARDLFEGLQAMVLVHLATAIEGHGLSISLGLPDSVLAPFVGEPVDRESMTDLVAAFILKVAANSFQGRGSKTQAITVGGADHTGRDRSNALTFAFLEAFDLVRVGDPHLFLRWHPDLDASVKRAAAGMLSSGASTPLLVNDPPTAAGLVACGVRPEDAWDYCVIGCNELGVPGRLHETAAARFGTIEYLGLLNEALFSHPDPDSINGTDEVLALLELEMLARARQGRRAGIERIRQEAACVPTPFTSALMKGCVARGRDMLVGMEYHVPGLYERGLTNAANALAAIEKLAFEERAVGLSRLVEASRRNFEGAGELRARIALAPKWGTDDDRADRWALRLVETRERVLNRVDGEFGHRAHAVCHVVRSLHHLDGRRLAASCDGRLAGAPLADSIGPQTGTARAGPTAALNSVLKLDASRYYRGGYNLNLTLTRANAPVEVVLALIEAFFADGGQELQLAVLDAEALRQARVHPERFGDLVVRFAGFSARFIDMSPAEQQELIERAEAAAR